MSTLKGQIKLRVSETKIERQGRVEIVNMLNSMKYEATREEQKRKSTPQRSFMDVLDEECRRLV